MSELEIGLKKETRMSSGILSKFTTFAYSDCHHDFGSTQIADLLENIPLNSSLSSFERARRIAKINADLPEYSGSIYKGLSQFLPSVIDSARSVSGAKKARVEKFNPLTAWDDETRLMTSITGINDVELKNKLKEIFKLSTTNAISQEDFDNIKEPVRSDISVQLSDSLVRNYKLSAFPYKLNISGVSDEAKHYKPPALVFKKVANANNIGFIYDASFLPLSKLKTPTGDADAYNFVFLKSIENDADSAGKIASFDAGSPNINIYAAIDEGNTSFFPTIDAEEENGNFFTKVPFQTERVGNTVNGIFEISPTNKITLTDLGEISNITNASQLAVNKLVEYLPSLSEEEQKEICIHLLTKRAGDWCQALCLLDKGRLYKIGGVTKSLAELEKTHKFGVLTHDRILLAYCLLIGVNCYFTMKLAPGNAVLLYFENSQSAKGTPEDMVSAAAFLSKKNLDSLSETLNAHIAEMLAEKEQFVSKIDALVLVKDGLKEYLEDLYMLFYKITSIAEVTSLQEELEKYKLQAISEITQENVLTYLYIFSNFKKEIDTIIGENNSVDFLEMPSTISRSIEELFLIVTNGKTLKQTSAFINFTETYIYSLKDLLKKYRGGNPRIPSIDIITESIPSKSKRLANRTDNAKYIHIFLNEMFKVQSGGVEKDSIHFAKQLNEQFFKLRHRSILALNTKEFIKAPRDGIHGTKFIAKLKDYVTDRHGNYYSVIDDYIITIDDCDLFITSGSPCSYLLNEFPSYANLNILTDRELYKKNRSTLSDDSYFEYMYMYLRFNLLHHDILYTKYQKLKNKYTAEFTNEDIVNDEEYKRLAKNIETLSLYIKKLKTENITIISRGVKGPLQKVYSLLNQIRLQIFSSYSSSRLFIGKNGKKLAYRNKLDEYLVNEAASILSLLKDSEREDYRLFIDEEEAAMKAEAATALTELYSENIETKPLDFYLGHQDEMGGGGFRKTRRHHPTKKGVRKTRGLKTRI